MGAGVEVIGSNDDGRRSSVTSQAMARVMVEGFQEWLGRPETRVLRDDIVHWTLRLIEGVRRTLEVQAARHADAVKAEKSTTLAAIELMPGGVHKADVPGLLTFGACDELIARAEAGGPARPKIHPYLSPAERFCIRISAFNRLMHLDPTLHPSQRRWDFDLLPHRDRWVHALVCGELQLARAAGLRGAEARNKADSAASHALTQYAVQSMRHLSRTAVRRTYREVEALAKGDRDGVVLPPLTAEAFKDWMTKGVLPAWLQD